MEFNMNKHDPALKFSNPRLLAAVYYGLLSVVGTILIDGLLTTIGVNEVIPLFQTIVLGMVVASITGALFAKHIIHCPKPYKKKTFFWGFIMVLLSLPFFVLGLVLFMDESKNQALMANNFYDWFSIYIVVLGYSYILFGFLLAIASGLASMYLRGQLVYHILHTDKRRSHRLPRYVRAHPHPIPKSHTMQRRKP
jgi:ABC-type tungstate transport system substrate-binding protein